MGMWYIMVFSSSLAILVLVQRASLLCIGKSSRCHVSRRSVSACESNVTCATQAEPMRTLSGISHVPSFCAGSPLCCLLIALMTANSAALLIGGFMIAMLSCRACDTSITTACGALLTHLQVTCELCNEQFQFSEADVMQYV